MKFSPTYVLESKACPGVTVTLRRMGPKLRAETELAISAARVKCREAAQIAEKLSVRLQQLLDETPGFREKVAALPEEKRGALPAEVLAMVPEEAWDVSTRKAEAEAQATAVERAEINPAFVLAAVKAIDGMESDEPFTAATLCEFGPEELFDEVVAAITDNSYLLRGKAENLSSPTTSGAQVDGIQTNSIAPAAN
jgi:hypothetical protein